MTDHFVLITTLVTAFGLALVFGYLAERFLRTPALVGYIIAGVAVTTFPGLPTVDVGVTEQFAEIGVMLLMFGVGLHFSVADLIKVKSVALTGALAQMTVSTLAGCLVAMLAWSWSWPMALVFGLTLSCASTVVVTKALELRHLTNGMNGQVVIGWLVVQDLVTVFIMVCLPLLAEVLAGGGNVSAKAIVVSLAKTFLGLAVFVAGMLIVGRRLFPWILRKVAELGSRELFTLCVLALAIGIAYGAGALFNVSYALGAFFAGMVMRESDFARRAAKNSLPLQDAFAVLFFVSVGLMLDWHVFIEEPLAVLSVILIIVGITSCVAAALVVLLGWPLDTALILGACVSQIGEFSFILCGQGINLGLADPSTMSLIVAASIVTIAINPIMFVVVPKVKYQLVTRYPYMCKSAMRQPPMSTLTPEASQRVNAGHIVIVGKNKVTQALLPDFQASGTSVVMILSPSDVKAREMKAREEEPNAPVIILGDATDPMVLVKARIMTAGALVLPGKDPIRNKQIFDLARQLRADLRVVIRSCDVDDAVQWVEDERTTVITDIHATAVGLEQVVAGWMGAHGPQPRGAAQPDAGQSAFTRQMAAAAKAAKETVVDAVDTVAAPVVPKPRFALVRRFAKKISF